MPTAPTRPGVHVEESPRGVRTIAGVPTSVAAFIGRTRSGPVNEPTTIHSFGDFERLFGGLAADCPVSYAVRDFYLNGGSQAVVVRLSNKAGLTTRTRFTGNRRKRTGMYALLKADRFNILCVPPDKRGDDLPNGVYQAAAKFCAERRAMLIVDPPSTPPAVTPAAASEAVTAFASSLSAGMGEARANAALYFPRVLQADPLQQSTADTPLAPSGAVAGVMARTDEQHGVWKAPAGRDAALRGIKGLAVRLTEAENGTLNPRAVNCLRSFPNAGHVVWGARTLAGDDGLASDWKYVPVRRTALYIEESLYRGTRWAAFEPNGEQLWGQIRLDVGAFMHGLYRSEAFQGRTPREAYFVKCDGDSTTRDDVNRGLFNIVVGFAPLKPAEFVIIKIQQLAARVR